MSGIIIEVTHPGDDEERKDCSYCHKIFKEEDERINTCTHIEYITLCRPCYDKAGNDVR